MSDEKEILEAEWSHFVNVDQIERSSMTLNIAPDSDQIKALVRRLNLLALDNVSASVELKRQAGGLVIEARGRVQGNVTQACVVTLDPVKDDIEETFEAWFTDPDSAVSLTKARKDREEGGERPMMNEADDPEEIIDGQIDIGELATQFLSLGINLYPHAEGVEPMNQGVGDQTAHEALKNPFAKLKDWKDRQR